MKKPTHSWSYYQNMAKSRYLFHSRLFMFHSLVQLLLPTVKLNGVSQPISIEYKMMHGLNQAGVNADFFQKYMIVFC